MIYNISTSPLEMVLCLWRRRSLIHATLKREILGRYRGSALGLIWSMINPLVMLAIYTYVFSMIFNPRWINPNASKAEFSLMLFVGLIIFNFFSECINRAPSLVYSNKNYVKKVIFPIEILPCVALLASLYHLFISLGIWILGYIFLIGLPHVTLLYFPLVFMPFALFVMGLSWLLAIVGVFFRDISHFIGLITSAMMFLSPIFYPASALPKAYQHFLFFNPLTPVIEMTRDVLYWGKVPSFKLLSLYWIVSFVFSWIGFACFQRARKGFADVL